MGVDRTDYIVAGALVDDKFITAMASKYSIVSEGNDPEDVYEFESNVEYAINNDESSRIVIISTNPMGDTEYLAGIVIYEYNGYDGGFPLTSADDYHIMEFLPALMGAGIPSTKCHIYFFTVWS